MLQTYFLVVTHFKFLCAKIFNKNLQSGLNNVWQTRAYDLATYTITSCDHIWILVTLFNCVTYICHICIYIVWLMFQPYLYPSHVPNYKWLKNQKKNYQIRIVTKIFKCVAVASDVIPKWSHKSDQVWLFILFWYI